MKTFESIISNIYQSDNENKGTLFYLILFYVKAVFYQGFSRDPTY